MNSPNTTSLSKRILGKDLNDLTYEYIESFFKEEREETENLEFKSGKGEFNKTLENNIIRTIAAFLNSSGGILIWGAPTEKKIEGETRKACFGDLTPLEESKDKDQLINKITGNISYMPTGVNLVKLEKDNEYIYIFEVKDSNSKPHQYNGIYYVRLDGQSKPAPHYLVDALFKQVKFADVRGYITFDLLQAKEIEKRLFMKVIIENRSPYINSKNVSFRIVNFCGLLSKSNNSTFNSGQFDVHYGQAHIENFQLNITIDELERNNHTFPIILALSGDNIESKVSKYMLDITFQTQGPFNHQSILKETYENRSFFEEDQLNNRLNPDETTKILLGRDVYK